MEAINKPRNFLIFIRLTLISIFAAIIAGTTMAIINVLIEIIKGNSIFGIEDLFSISLWHMSIWFCFGAILGIIYAVFSALRRKIIFKNSYYLIYFYIFIACWILLIGYINIYFLPIAVSLQSLIWNFILFIIGIFLLIIVLKYAKISKLIKFPLFLKFYIGILIITLIFSFLVNTDFLTRQKKIGEIGKMDGSNNINVIIILLDAVRPDHLGCYGYKRQTSPNIDGLSADGVVFENAFAQSSRTNESVPSLFSSTYPSTHKVKTLTSALPKNLLILPHIFKSNGYKTSVFSANGLVSPTFGYKRGVDDFFGYETNIITRTILSHLLSTFFVKVPLLGRISYNFLRFSHSLFPSKSSLNSQKPDYITQKVISWISDNQDNPFFLYVHYMGGHSPYNPPGPYDRLFDPNYPSKPITSYPQNLGMFLPFIEGKSLPQRELENMIAQYDGEIFYHDKNLGFLFNHLKKLNLDNKTIIVVTADHGEEFYEHNGWAHGNSLFDEVIQVPLIFYCPRLMTKGKRIKELAGLVDVFPTLLSLCGIYGNLNLPYKIEGIDLSPALLSTNLKYTKEFIFSEVSHGGHSAKCIRTKNFKAIKIRFGRKMKHLLFNLVSDPYEMNNIYDEEVQIGTKLFKMIDLIVSQAERFKPQHTIIDERMKEQLRSLGYIK